MIPEKVTSADLFKIQITEVLEEAVRKLRNANMSPKSEDVKRILHEIEKRVNQFKIEIDTKYQKTEAGYPTRTKLAGHIIIAS